MADGTVFSTCFEHPVALLFSYLENSVKEHIKKYAYEWK